jgi:Protein of unknown function (DUF1570)
MKRHILVLIALLFLTNWAAADFLLIKVDFDAIPFKDIVEGKEPKFLEKVGGGDSANLVYGIFEFDPGDLTVPNRPKPPPEEKKAPFDKKQPVDKKPPVKEEKAEVLFADLKREGGNRFIIPELRGVFNIIPLIKKPLVQEFRERKAAAKTVLKIMDLAFWTLQHGLTSEFHATMIELQRAAPDHPAFLRYKKMSDDLKKKLPDAPDALAEPQITEGLRKELKKYKNSMLSEQEHYVIHWKDAADVKDKEATEITKDQIQRRLARLENTFANFYYYCALQTSMPLPALPKHRLAVLVEHNAEYNKRLKKEGVADRQTSGYTIRRENLLVLSSFPNTDVFDRLVRNVKQVRLGRGAEFSERELVTGAVWKRPEARNANNKPKLDVAVLHTLVVLQTAMENDIEVTTISREGTRQLLGANFLARNVAMPQWLQIGLVSFFETPIAHTHNGFGLPRKEYLDPFLDLIGKGKKVKHDNLLNDMATDRCFRVAKKDDKGAEGRIDPDTAQGAAWSLVYFLATAPPRKMDYLSQYAHLLNGLPRHMTLHPVILEECFKRGFNSSDALDKRRLQPAEWFIEMKDRVTLEDPVLDDFFKTLRKLPILTPASAD